MKRLCSVGVVALALASTQAVATTINIDFAPNVDVTPGNAGSDIYSVDYSGVAAAPDAGTVWNILDAGNTGANGYNFEDVNIGLYDEVAGAVSGPHALVDSSGAATGLTATFDAGGAFAVSDNAGNLGNIATDAVGLMRDYLIAFNDPNPRYVTISGLNPGQQVELFLYGEGDNTSNDRSTLFNANGVIGSTTGDAGGAPLTLGSDYVKLTGVFADGAGDVTILYSPNGTPEGPFNGLQLTTVPEPAGVALLALAGLAATACRRW
ncbi:MAG: PEP-CTERM sorting domain-containing protein [Planctomycetales bacterium]|nr:PEP-CTERM sorting domain-containing protein [Planctomycetales bacterium]